MHTVVLTKSKNMLREPHYAVRPVFNLIFPSLAVALTCLGLASYLPEKSLPQCTWWQTAK